MSVSANLFFCVVLGVLSCYREAGSCGRKVVAMASSLRRQVDALRHASSGTSSAYIQRKKGKPSLLLTPDQVCDQRVLLYFLESENISYPLDIVKQARWWLTRAKTHPRDEDLRFRDQKIKMHFDTTKHGRCRKTVGKAYR